MKSDESVDNKGNTQKPSQFIERMAYDMYAYLREYFNVTAETLKANIIKRLTQKRQNICNKRYWTTFKN